MAETYRRQGLTYLADQLEQLRQELDSSATVYAQILRDRQLSDARIQAMQQQANTEMFQMRQRSIDYTRQAYAESNRRFMETTFGHTAGFNNYGGGAFCPRCGRPVYGYHGGTCGCCY